MAKNKLSLRDIKLVYRPSTPLVKCAVLAAVLLTAVCLLALRSSLASQKQEALLLRQQALQLEQENASIRRQIGDLGTEQSIRQIAQDRLGLVDPETSFFSSGE